MGYQSVTVASCVRCKNSRSLDVRAFPLVSEGSGLLFSQAALVFLRRDATEALVSCI